MESPYRKLWSHFVYLELILLDHIQVAVYTECEAKGIGVDSHLIL